MPEWYKMIMDSEANPLKDLHKPRRFQIMIVLSFMWTTIFCFSLGAWFWFDELMFAHVAALLGIAITAMTFRQRWLDDREFTPARLNTDGRRV